MIKVEPHGESCSERLYRVSGGLGTSPHSKGEANLPPKYGLLSVMLNEAPYSLRLFRTSRTTEAITFAPSSVRCTKVWQVCAGKMRIYKRDNFGSFRKSLGVELKFHVGIYGICKHFD